MGSGENKEKEKWGLDLNLSIQEEFSTGLGFQDFLGEEKEAENDHRGHDFGRGSDFRIRERDLAVETDDFTGSKRLRYTIEEKGKAKVDCGGSQVSPEIDLNLDLRGFEKDPVEGKMDTRPFEAELLGSGPVMHNFFPDRIERNTQVENYDVSRKDIVFEHRKEIALSSVRKRQSRRKEQKLMQREIARNVAPRFAHLGPQEQIKQHKEKKVKSREVDLDLDDSQSPFSMALEAIKMRQSFRKGSLTSFSESFFKQVPAKAEDCNVLKRDVPTLLDLSLKALAKNADAIVSLEHVPDKLRHRLSQLVSDCGVVDAQFVELLARGSPTEIRLRNISRLTEEEFAKIFSVCDTKDLTVLQLDLCGRCMPDYILRDTLARSSHRLPSLATISLKGAHRLTDIGLTQLAVSAPALQSINLSQCSLLTSQGISDFVSCFESTLRELYIDDCQNIDATIILPALKKLKCLEVLSVAGIETVCDNFVIGLVKACGINMKELGFANCVQLTDISLRIVGKNCPNLCALDLSYLHNLTDSALKHLANGCQSFRRLKLRRNDFRFFGSSTHDSDEAIAAFLEVSGQSLDTLSVNNIHRVAHNTAISIAKCSRNLVSLDLSWCRKLTDEALGMIVDCCLSLKLLKLFGCTQITEAFLNGHSNPRVRIIGCKTGPVLEHLDALEPQENPLRYSPLTSFC
ncbi:hypothetical protein SADUNF_Sadunf06G0174400 [Salix dunnii]|uniref:F-box/LRR-repeat protein 15-like leucin rich repeat domain-containing protein n=1 Tax=Salix dunnii TaxID=1413687 RepID=A0A835N128_9ROSI|nr:hypothetical protein SADUNF_Sadunf06G0174400 [Salix dunnii]